MRPRPLVTGLFILLLASAGLNAYLLTRRPGPDAMPTAQRTDAPAADPKVQSSESTQRQVSQSIPLAGASLGEPPSAQSCEVRLSAMATELDKARAQMDRYLPPEVKFQSGSPDSRSAERLRQELQRFFNRDGGTIHWVVECGYPRGAHRRGRGPLQLPVRWNIGRDAGGPVHRRALASDGRRCFNSRLGAWRNGICDLPLAA